MSPPKGLQTQPPEMELLVKSPEPTDPNPSTVEVAADEPRMNSENEEEISSEEPLEDHWSTSEEDPFREESSHEPPARPTQPIASEDLDAVSAEDQQEKPPAFPYELGDSEFLDILKRELAKDMSLGYSTQTGEPPQLKGRVLSFYPNTSLSRDLLIKHKPTIIEVARKLCGESLEIEIEYIKPITDIEKETDPWIKKVEEVRNIFRGQIISRKDG